MFLNLKKHFAKISLVINRLSKNLVQRCFEAFDYFLHRRLAGKKIFINLSNNFNYAIQTSIHCMVFFHSKPVDQLWLIIKLKCARVLSKRSFVIFLNHVNEVPRLRSQTESRYVQIVPDKKCLCPDRPRRKVCMSTLSCVHQTFVGSFPDFCAITRLSCVHVQTSVRSPDFRVLMSRLSCVHI